MGGTAAPKPAMVSARAGDQLVMTRSTAKLASLAEGVATFVGDVTEYSVSDVSAAELFAQRAYRARTKSSGQSHLTA